MPTGADLQEMIVNLLTQIECVRSELSRHGGSLDTGGAAAEISLESVQRLKTSIDQFRLFLWAYLDTRAAAEPNAESRLRLIRAESAADMVRRLALDFRSFGIPHCPEALRLRDQVLALAALFQSAGTISPRPK